MAGVSQRKSVTNWITIAASVFALLIAISILYVVEQISWFDSHRAWQNIFEEIASFVFVTGLISILWELGGKRALLAEAFEIARISERIRNAGLVDVCADFMGDVDWQSLFANAHEIDIFFAYGGSWRGAHIDRLRALLRRAGARMRVILPDPEDGDVMAELTRRGMKGVESKIRESIHEFEQLANAAETKRLSRSGLSLELPFTASIASMIEFSSLPIAIATAAGLFPPPRFSGEAICSASMRTTSRL